MQILSTSSKQVIQRTITFQDEDGSVYHYKEWDEDGTIIDTQIVDKNGNQLDIETDNVLIEKIQTQVDELFEEEGFPTE